MKLLQPNVLLLVSISPFYVSKFLGRKEIISWQRTNQFKSEQMFFVCSNWLISSYDLQSKKRSPVHLTHWALNDGEIMILKENISSILSEGNSYVTFSNQKDKARKSLSLKLYIPSKGRTFLHRTNFFE